MQKNKSSTCFPVTVRQANDDKAGKAFETQIKCKANSYFNNSLSLLELNTDINIDHLKKWHIIFSLLGKDLSLSLMKW